MNTQKFVTIGYVLMGVVTFFIMRQFGDFIWETFRLPLLNDQWMIQYPDIVGIVSGILVFVTFKRWQAANVYANEVVVELSKVTWPMRNNTLMSTVIVIGMVGLASLLLFAFDSLWGTLISKLLPFGKN